MLSTTLNELTPTITRDGGSAPQQPNDLLGRYTQIVVDKRLNWTSHHQLTKLLGAGGQGVVFLTERRGADEFTLPVAAKIFSPERYEDSREYDEAMARIARVSSRVAQIQQDNLLDVHNFVERNRIRMMPNLSKTVLQKRKNFRILISRATKQSRSHKSPIGLHFEARVELESQTDNTHQLRLTCHRVEM